MSLVFPLQEPVVKAFIAQAEAHAPALVEEINKGVTDAFTIPSPAQYLDFLPTPAQLGTGLPVLAIGDGPIRILNDLVYTAESEATLAIEAIVQDADPRALTWKMRRYLKLILNILQADRTLKGTCHTTRIKSIEPGGLAGPRNPEMPVDGYIQWNYVLIETPKDEV